MSEKPAIKLNDVAPAVAALTFDQLKDLLLSLKGPESEDLLRKHAQINAEAMATATGQQAVRPHPGISVFSYPEGDLARPRPDLKCKMFWVGHPLEDSTVTAEERELLNQAEPGIFPITKTDGSRILLTVTAERDGQHALTKLLFTFPCRGEHKHNLPSMTDMLREAYGRLSDEKTVLLAELTRLRAEVAARS